VTEYPTFRAVITIQRKVTVILIKTLLPILLLVLVVYVTLHFPITLAQQRLLIPTSSLLAGAILLTGINSQLPEATYTTAIEYGFYVFFGLCLFCVIVTLIGERLQNAKREKTLKRFNIISRLIYLCVLAVTIGVYLFLFSQRIA